MFSFLNENRKKLPLTIWLKVLTVELAVLEVVYLTGAIFFANHFLLNSQINGVDVSLMTPEQAQLAIETALEDYKLEIQEQDGKTELIWGTDIDLQFELSGNAEDSMNKQFIFFWFTSPFKKRSYTLASDVTYDSEKLQDRIHGLLCLQEGNYTEPVEPQIIREENGFFVQEGIEGNQVSLDVLQKVIESSVSDLMTYVNLDDEKCYIELKYHANSPEVQFAVKQLNQILETEVTYRLGGRTEYLTGGEMIEWVSVSEDFEIVVDSEALKTYTDNLKRIYQANGTPVEFQTATGETAMLNSYVVNNGEALLDPGYLADILRNEAKNGKTEYLWDSENLSRIADTYIEINLSTQHMYCYRNGRLLLGADIVSGMPGNGTNTPKGVFSIRAKVSPLQQPEENKDNEENEGNEIREVTYWLGFDGDIALYDADWQRVFGSNYYRTNGSDGSIEMSVDAAAFIYENYGIGDYVIIYDEDDFAEPDEEGEEPNGPGTTPHPDTPENPTTPSNPTTTEQPSGNTTTELPSGTTTERPSGSTTERPSGTTTEQPSSTESTTTEDEPSSSEPSTEEPPEPPSSEENPEYPPEE